MLSQPIEPGPTISPSLPGGAPLPPRRGRLAPRQKVRLASDDEVLFYRKLQEAKRHLEALERTLAPITHKLNAAGLEEEIELTDELDEIEGLIWEHNDALEVARDAWLRGDLGSKAFDQLMLMSSPAAFGLPLFVDQDQAKRAQQQGEEIGKRLKQRIAFFDNVILAMQVMETAGLAASLVLGPGLAIKAAVAVGKVAVAKTVVKIGVGWVATQVAGKVIDETLRAVGVEDETIEHVQVAAEIITWLLFARRVHKGRLKKKVEGKTEAPAAVQTPERVASRQLPPQMRPREPQRRPAWIAGRMRRANTTRGWRVGDPIDNPTAKGKVPSWSTVRQRYWKNEAHYNADNYTAEELARMKRGLAPQRLNPDTGLLESKELHHTPPRREGGLFNVVQVWPDDHAAMDIFRQTGR